MTKFNELFNRRKPLIGMIHLSGEDDEKVERAIEELAIYEEEGLDGAIIEDYHGEVQDVEDVLKNINCRMGDLVLGINILRDQYYAFELAHKYKVSFIQFDSVQTPDLQLDVFEDLRERYQNIALLGGVRFKYTRDTGKPLKYDLKEAIRRCEAVVTTGEGTGIETPLQKLVEFKSHLKDFPLIVGAGLNAENAYEQLKIADGAIIGSHFKPDGNTALPVERKRVRELIDIVNKLRK